jgi:hypothetical protein
VLDTDEFIKAITDAINSASGDETKPVVEKSTPKKSTKKPPVVEEEHDQEDIELLAALREAVDSVEEKEEDTPPFDVNEEIEDIFPDEETEDEDTMITLGEDRANTIRDAFRAANATTKAAVKKHLVEYGGKMADTMKTSDVNAIEEILGLNDEV